MNWFDAIIIVVLLIFMAFGIKKGFMFSVIDMFGFFVNFVISIFLTNPMHNLLNFMGMQSSIANGLYSKYASYEGFTTDLIEYQNVNGNVTDYVNQTINNSPLNGFAKKLFNGTINHNLAQKLEQSSNTTVSLADIMSKALAQFITVVVAFVISFVIIYLILFILRIVSKKLKESTFVNVFDKIFGAGFGLVRGFMFIVLVFVVLSFFSDNGILSSVIGYINKSAIGHWLRQSVNTFMVEYVDIKQFIIDILQKI